jgi:hypothetical protein
MSDIEDAYREASVGMCAVCGLSVCVCVWYMCGACAHDCVLFWAVLMVDMSVCAM